MALSAKKKTRSTSGTVSELLAEAFPESRPARSNVYMDGARTALMFHMRMAALYCPYAEGSASFDAFNAGVAEGREIWARHLESMRPATTPSPQANAADLLAAELLHAEKIILAMLALMTPRQKVALGEKLDTAGIIGTGGTTRYHERHAALVTAGFAQPEPAGKRPCAHAFAAH